MVDWNARVDNNIGERITVLAFRFAEWLIPHMRGRTSDNNCKRK